ncbi:unnamed protein product [Cylicocyclus nassatus]|uniref:Uncharacterized protein n=1 Tax=Cylicocyclus nassatus TaxID=53992 RepID=A0AA36DK51_CYLNA|nr:unnamed protein product [Cylicocyclus nassatus]
MYTNPQFVTQSTSTQVSEMLHMQDNASSLTERIKNRIDDTAPFKRNELVPPFKHGKAKIMTAINYHLSACLIRKVMSTTMEAIFCYLNNSTEFTRNNRTISTEVYENRFCHGKFGWPKNRDKKPNVLFVTVRHPIQRFVSGYVEKCMRKVRVMRTICFGCKDDLQCFIKNLYTALKEVYAGLDDKYESHKITLSHFSPQSWNCLFYDHFDDYIMLHQGENAESIAAYASELDKVFKSVDVPSDRRKEICSQLLGKRMFAINNLAVE